MAQNLHVKKRFRNAKKVKWINTTGLIAIIKVFCYTKFCLHLYLFNEVDGSLQVQAEIDELPVDAFLAVLLLLQDEHVVVEELLQTLVSVVDAQLLKGVHREDLKASNVQHSNKEVLPGLYKGVTCVM